MVRGAPGAALPISTVRVQGSGALKQIQFCHLLLPSTPTAPVWSLWTQPCPAGGFTEVTSGVVVFEHPKGSVQCSAFDVYIDSRNANCPCGDKGDEEHPHLPCTKTKPGIVLSIYFQGKLLIIQRMETGLFSESTDVTQGYDCHD